MRGLLRIVGGLAMIVVALFVVFLVGMRRKSPVVVDSVRRFNKSVTNRAVLKTAGEPGAGAAVICHAGRVSGRAYETPIGPFPIDDGYVIALPYGPGADWVRNVLAAGSATLRYEGETVPVDRPEVVPTASVRDRLPASEQRTLRMFGVDECLVIRLAGATAESAAGASTEQG
jgi:deazaflavin-dependent oxidoreductase (nitroreductase family)